MKKFYSFIKSLKRDSFGILPLALRSEGRFVSENVKKADILNRQFESVFCQERLDNLQNLTTHKYPCMPDIHINNHGVKQLLTDLDPNKAIGRDGVPARVLKMGQMR